MYDVLVSTTKTLVTSSKWHLSLVLISHTILSSLLSVKWLSCACAPNAHDWCKKEIFYKSLSYSGEILSGSVGEEVTDRKIAMHLVTGKQSYYIYVCVSKEEKQQSIE